MELEKIDRIVNNLHKMTEQQASFSTTVQPKYCTTPQQENPPLKGYCLISIRMFVDVRYKH